MVLAPQLAAAQCSAQKHRQNRAVPFSFRGLEVGLSQQVARPFPAEPVPCPGAGLADALEEHDSQRHAAIEQSVFGRFCGQLPDRRPPQIDGSGRQARRFQNAPVLLNDGSAKGQPGFGRVPGEEILQGLFAAAFGACGGRRRGRRRSARYSAGTATARALSDTRSLQLSRDQRKVDWPDGPGKSECLPSLQAEPHPPIL